MLSYLARAIPVIALAALPLAASAQVLQFGDQDVLGTATYPSDPTAGATLVGSAPAVITFGAAPLPHGFPFSPGPGEFAGTDTIYVGSVQTGAHDGYSGAGSRVNGPLVLTLNYSSLVPAGQSVATLTLGLAFDDFQNAVFGQPFTVSINGQPYAPLTNLANSLNQTGPVVQFATIGLDTSLLTPDHVLTVSIDQGGDGGDGFAIDFATVGVTVPAPSAGVLLGLAGLAASRRRR
jgi:hypothetical protein